MGNIRFDLGLVIALRFHSNENLPCVVPNIRNRSHAVASRNVSNLRTRSGDKIRKADLQGGRGRLGGLVTANDIFLSVASNPLCTVRKYSSSLAVNTRDYGPARSQEPAAGRLRLHDRLPNEMVGMQTCRSDSRTPTPAFILSRFRRLIFRKLTGYIQVRQRHVLPRQQQHLPFPFRQHRKHLPGQALFALSPKVPHNWPRSPLPLRLLRACRLPGTVRRLYARTEAGQE